MTDIVSLAPQIAVAMAMIAAVAWFQRQNLAQVKALMHAAREERDDDKPPPRPSIADTSGSYQPPPVSPLADDIKAIRQEQREQRAAINGVNLRLTAIAQDVKWLKGDRAKSDPASEVA